MIQLDTTIVVILMAFFVPAVVAFASNMKAPALIKSAVNVVASLVVGAVSVLSQNPDGLPFKEFAVAVVVALLASDVMYDTVWKPTGAFKRIQQAFPRGIGAEVILDSEPGLNPDKALYEVRDMVKPIFTTEQWQKLQDVLDKQDPEPDTVGDVQGDHPD